MPKTNLEDALAHKYRVHTDGPTVPGVTTVINIIEKPALKWAAAKIAAEEALDLFMDQADGDHLDPEEFVHHCRGAFDRQWREKAKRGNRVHTVAEEWAKGNTIEVPMSDQGFVDALEKFYRDLQPKTLMAERIVIHPVMEYGGRFDAIMEIDQKLWLIDFKTGGKYPQDVAMQTSAYMEAMLANYHEDGSLGHFERLPELAGARIIYLREDGQYDLVDPFELIPRETAFRAFTNALELYKAVREMDKMTKEKK